MRRVEKLDLYVRLSPQVLHVKFKEKNAPPRPEYVSIEAYVEDGENNSLSVLCVDAATLEELNPGVFRLTLMEILEAALEGSTSMTPDIDDDKERFWVFWWDLERVLGGKSIDD